MITQNLGTVAGDSHTLTVTVKDRDNDAVDITSASITWKAARTIHKTAVLTKTTSNGGIGITNGAGGVFTITISAGDTSGFTGDYYHEVQVTFADGTVSTVLSGTMTVIPALI